MQGKVPSQESATSAAYVGVDVCKEWLNIHIHPLGRAMRLANSRSGIRQLRCELVRLKPSAIVVEATGKFHRHVHRMLYDDGFPIAVIDPFRARMHMFVAVNRTSKFAFVELH